MQVQSGWMMPLIILACLINREARLIRAETDREACNTVCLLDSRNKPAGQLAEKTNSGDTGPLYTR